MTRSPSLAARRVLVLAAVLVAVAGCSKKESLVLLDLRASGPLGAPVAFVRLSAPGGKTRTISGAIGPDGFQVGYYGPVQDDAISVTAEALDGLYCTLGRGSATVTSLESGATSEPTKLFIRPVPASGCMLVDAGGGQGDTDAGTDTGVQDTGIDTSHADTSTADTSTADTGGADTSGDTAVDAASDTGNGDTSSTDGGTDATAGDATGDAGTDAATDGASSDASKG